MPPRQSRPFGQGRSREVGRPAGGPGGEPQRILNEMAARERARRESPEGKAALIAEYEQSKIRARERVDTTQEWVQNHIADTALKLAMAYGREEPNNEDRVAASVVVGATFNAVQEADYQNMPKPGWRFE